MGSTAEGSPLWPFLSGLELPQRVTLIVVLILGVIGFARIMVYIMNWVYVFLLRPAVDIRYYGPWAIVTGSTDGIGKAYARQLAKIGLNIVLVSRSEEKLTDTAQELEKEFGVETRTVAADFSKPGDELEAALVKLFTLVRELEVGILINNAGVSYPYARRLHEVDDELLFNLVNVNVIATTRVTKIALYGMIQRKKGAIIFIGSGAATVLPSDPLYAVYAGTKAYVDQLARSLYVEYAKLGINVQCQAPLYVATKMSKIRRPSITCPSPEAYARAGIAWIGQDARCTPYWAHGLIWGLIWMFPEDVVDSLRIWQTETIRRKAIAKEMKKKQEE